MSVITLTLNSVALSDYAVARKMVSEYREANGGSNRANWERIISVLASVLHVVRTGMPVDVTDIYADSVGKAPAYNVLHRQLSAGVIRPLWQSVQAVALINVTYKGKTVVGTPSSTARFDQGAKLFICPVE